MTSALNWKRFYDRERATLSPREFDAFFDRAPHIDFPERGAIVFPHTRLRDSGHLVAAAARAAIASGRGTILAIGVLHGGREHDAQVVRAARDGDPSAIAQFRGIHGPDAPNDGGIWSEEFSLDNFNFFVSLAAKRLNVTEPRVIARYPFLVGEHPHTLSGLDELRSMLAGGAALVATTDPVHHGAGYGTAPDERLDPSDSQTSLTARQWIEEGFGHLARHRFNEFLANAARVRSDFRDAGPVLVHLLGEPLNFDIPQLTLVDYADVLHSDDPTWVAAALARFY